MLGQKISFPIEPLTHPLTDRHGQICTSTDTLCFSFRYKFKNYKPPRFYKAALTFDLALFVQDQLASSTSGPTLRVANQQVRRLIRGVPQCSLRAYCPSSR
ncbi:hypothetical protein T03_5608 [Trichinella britovi]|uniref:Uncharacterized protein n=1 Tax=Trichinella britovi TaxID=45882 RepID=A0A0V1D8F1_TRIBR|nr:hypothetical protein T03_5608 [Trichinella britovi]